VHTRSFALFHSEHTFKYVNFSNPLLWLLSLLSILVSKPKLRYDRWSVGQSLLVSNHPSGSQDQISVTSGRCAFVDVWRGLWREDGSTVYNCCWSSPAQSFLGASNSVLVAVFYCRRFETPRTSRARSPYLYPPGKGWPGHTTRHWVLFSSPLTTRMAAAEVFGIGTRPHTDDSNPCIVTRIPVTTRVNLFICHNYNWLPRFPYFLNVRSVSATFILWSVNALPGNGSINTPRYAHAEISRMFIVRC
jgi:hypothetical protein